PDWSQARIVPKRFAELCAETFRLCVRQPFPESVAASADERAALMAWAVDRWDAEVNNRPLINVHRRSLDDTWRQVIRHCGGDDVSLLGPRHDDLLAANPIGENHEARAAASPAAEAVSIPMATPALYFYGDHERGFECPDDAAIVSGRKLGDRFTLTAAWYADVLFEVTKVPDDVSDDYEVREVPTRDPGPSPVVAAPQPAQDDAPVRAEALRKGLFEARDAMRVMSNWVKKSDPAGHSWAVRMVDRANAVLNGEADTVQADAPAEAREPHSDDVAVDTFAAAMKHKLALARAKGRHGWETCSPADLSRMLREHVEKGDPHDVANFCMMLWHHGSPIVGAAGDAGEARLTDEQREAIEYAITWMDQNVSNRYAYTAAKELRALLNGAGQ
ncbi:hypothetical protein KTE49_30365, partial [Burkholderia multivorans]|nr:hypothetical protein [Burkholderia multivorans]